MPRSAASSCTSCSPRPRSGTRTGSTTARWASSASSSSASSRRASATSTASSGTLRGERLLRRRYPADGCLPGRRRPVRPHHGRAHPPRRRGDLPAALRRPALRRRVRAVLPPVRRGDDAPGPLQPEKPAASGSAWTWTTRTACGTWGSLRATRPDGQQVLYDVLFSNGGVEWYCGYNRFPGRRRASRTSGPARRCGATRASLESSSRITSTSNRPSPVTNCSCVVRVRRRRDAPSARSEDGDLPAPCADCADRGPPAT